MVPAGMGRPEVGKDLADRDPVVGGRSSPSEGFVRSMRPEEDTHPEEGIRRIVPAVEVGTAGYCRWAWVPGGQRHSRRAVRLEVCRTYLRRLCKCVCIRELMGKL